MAELSNNLNGNGRDPVRGRVKGDCENPLGSDPQEMGNAEEPMPPVVEHHGKKTKDKKKHQGEKSAKTSTGSLALSEYKMTPKEVARLKEIIEDTTLPRPAGQDLPTADEAEILKKFKK